MKRRLIIGGSIITTLLACAVISFWWTPVEMPMRLRIGARLKAPFEAGLLGTDQLGRDVLSLLMLASRNTLLVAVSSVAVGTALGSALGLVAAIRRSWVETLTMRLADLLFAFPPILSAMMLGAALGSGFGSAIAAIAIFTIPVFARTVRAKALQILATDYVRAAKALGVRDGAILWRHVMPNVAGELSVQISLQLGLAILTEAGLSFLGLGPAPPAPSWGRMLADAQTYLGTAPWLAIAPGVTIACAVLGFQMLGDGLRDRFDPRVF